MDARRLLARLSTPAAGCALAAVLTSLAAALAVMAPHDFDPSALVHVGRTEPMAQVARTTDPDFVLYPSSSHYDGVYYYAIARDPLVRNAEHELIDLAAYRYSHAGFGWLVWLASAGRPGLIPEAMLAVALVCAGVAGAAASLLAKDLGISAWWGLAVAVNPGLVYSVTVVTSEAAGLASLLVGLSAWRRGRHVGAALALAAACLIKEPFLLVPVAIAAYEVIRWLRVRRAAEEARIGAVLRRLAPLSLGPLVYGGWYVYISSQFDAWPTEQSREFTSFLFTGWLDTFDRAAALADADFTSAQIGAITIPLLVVVGVALLVGLLRALRFDSEVQTVFVALALVAFSLNWWNLLYPKDFLRAVTVQLALLPFVFAPRWRDRRTTVR